VARVMTESLTALFADMADCAADIVACDPVAVNWAKDSALAGYTVGGLCGHLARAVFTVEQYLHQEPPQGDTTVVDAAQYFAAVLGHDDPEDSALHAGIRERAQETAQVGPQALAVAIRTTATHLRNALEVTGVARLVTVRDELAMTVEEYLRTRLVELVVHLDDVVVSVEGLESPLVSDLAYVEVAGVLGRLAALRVDGLATVRSLARRERHPDAVRAL
jgi:hypothetical protein